MDDLKQYIKEETKVSYTLESDGCFEVTVNSDSLVEHLNFLKNDFKCRFEMLIDIFAVDYPDREKRFEVVYMLLSITHNLRIRCKVAVSSAHPVPSIVTIFSAAGWFEREVFDMYGIVFSDNPDLRRILTDYGFKGHPMLKDFPLTGYEEVRYDLEAKKVVYSPVDLQQEFRSFEFLSPWESGKSES